MHTLAAAQQAAVTASSSLCWSSSHTAASLLLHGLLPSSQIRCDLFSISVRKEGILRTMPSSSSLAATSYAILFRGKRLPFRSNATAVLKSGNRLSEYFGHDRLVKKKICLIQCLASRKDRREMAAGEDEFEPDIVSLRTGFSKRFPGQNSSAFERDWSDFDDVDKDDGVEVKSFKGGNNYGRGPRSPTISSNNARNKYNSNNNNSRTGNKPENLSSRLGGIREEVTANEWRKAPQDINRQRVGLRDSRNYRGTGKVNDFRSENRRKNEKEGDANIGARPRIERGEAGGGRRSTGYGEARGNDSTSKISRDDSERILGNNGNVGVRQSRDYSSRPVRKGREPYGGAEEWSRDTPIFEDEGKKKKQVIEPVNFTSTLSKSPHVAILGGGMSGLVCALTLEEHGIQSTVFDTGKHGLGGRMATRSTEDHNGVGLVFDHAAQFFTVTDPRFQNLVDRWNSEKLVKKWDGNVGTLQAGGHFSELPLATRYIGTNGMRSLADSMLSQSRLINVKRPCWISRMDATNGRWILTENRKPQGEFDVVVIAHNGKCANRLLSTAHVPLVARQMKRLELSSVWALLAAFKEPLLLPGGKILDGAFVDGVDSLSWIGNNSSKLFLPDDKTPQCWTFLSTAAYGKRNKVPQESIPVVKAQKVKHDMLRGVEDALGLSKDSLPIPTYTRLQLWGAALPTNTPDVPCIFDAQGRVGICGDWLLGSSLEAAALSGMALADHIAKYRNSGDQDGEDFNIGLQQSFSVVKGSDIGQFPGTEELRKQSPEVLAIA